MAITINVKCSTEEEMFKIREEFHNGLCGSPAYINSEICLSDATDDPASCMLIIGNCNNNDVEYDIHNVNLLKK